MRDVLNLSKDSFINAGIIGDLTIIINYIDQIDITKKNSILLCESVLRNAAFNGHLDIVKYIHEQGISIHGYNELALSFAIEGDQLDIVEYLIKIGADINNSNILNIISSKGYSDIIKHLIDER
jgi:ankyrin repeat protein